MPTYRTYNFKTTYNKENTKYVFSRFISKINLKITFCFKTLYVHSIANLTLVSCMLLLKVPAEMSIPNILKNTEHFSRNGLFCEPLEERTFAIGVLKGDKAENAFVCLLRVAKRRSVCKDFSPDKGKNIPFAPARLEESLLDSYRAAHGRNINQFFTPAEVVHFLHSFIDRSIVLDSQLSSSEKAYEYIETTRVWALHDHEWLDAVFGENRIFWSLWSINDSKICRYFGVNVGVYFAFQRHLGKWLLPLILFGSTVSIFQYICSSYNLYLRFSLTFFCAIWSSLFVEAWKRKSHVFLLDNFAYETDMPQIFRKKVRHTSHFFVRLVAVSLCAFVTLLSCGFFILFLVWLEAWCTSQMHHPILKLLPGIASALMLSSRGLESFFLSISRRLAAFENHTFQEFYFQSLFAKKAIFHVFNSIAFFLFLAFWQKSTSALTRQLLAFMTVKQALATVSQLVIPYLRYRLVKWGFFRRQHGINNGTKDDKFREGKVSRAMLLKESEGFKCKYEVFEDWSQMAVHYSLLVCFAPVFPMGAVLAFLNIIVEIWTDSFKLLRVCQRVVPSDKDAILVNCFTSIFDFMSVFAVMTNLYQLHIDFEEEFPLGTCVACEHVIVLLKVYLNWAIPNVPDWVVLERARRNFSQHEKWNGESLSTKARKMAVRKRINN